MNFILEHVKVENGHYTVATMIIYQLQQKISLIRSDFLMALEMYLEINVHCQK
jgi:hypothetical protein